MAPLRKLHIPALSVGVSLIALGPAVADPTQMIDVPAQPLVDALNELGQETGLQIIVSEHQSSGLRSAPVSGIMSPTEALETLLAGTGLRSRYIEQDSAVLASGDIVSQNAPLDEAFELDTILITARRTEEELKDVPASVAILSGETLEDANISDFSDAAEQLPNVNIGTNSDPRRGEVAIRGISNLNIVGTAPTVGVFQNGVLQNPSGQRFNVNPNLVDLERVEVIYGPQGTAFGRGTIGGAVNFVTNKPSFVNEGSVTLGFSDLGDITAEAVVNAPLSDSFAIRAVGYGSIEDGFVETPFIDGLDTLGSGNRGARVTLRFQPDDRLTVDTSLQYDLSTFDAPVFAFEDTVSDGDPISAIGFFEETEIERINGTIDATYEVDAGRFRFTTGYLDSSLIGSEDFDFSPDDNATLRRDDFEESFSQEIRFESRSFELGQGLGSASFNIGVNYSDTSSGTVSDFSALFFGLPGRNLATLDLDTKSQGLFGDIRWVPVDGLEIALGGRYSRDQVSVSSVNVPTGSLAALIGAEEFSERETYSSFTPNASIVYDWTDSFTTYASYSEGYRPGGFVGSLAGGAIAFDEESAKGYEIGLRKSFMDGAVSVNASAFLLEYEDIQVPIPADAGGGIDNAARARSEGVELSIAANPLPGLVINGALGYVDARFTDYEDAPSGDLSGEQLSNAPRTTYSLMADYEFQKEFRGVTPFVRGEVNGTSDYTSLPGSDVNVGDYTLVNLRAGFRSEKIDVTFYVENLFDERYAVDAAEFGTFGVAPPAFAGQSLQTPGEPRKVGVIASMRF